MTPYHGHAAAQRRLRIVGLLGTVALVTVTAAGCGSAHVPTGAPSGAPAPTVGRAAQLKLDEADPCSILSRQERGQLGVGDGTLARSKEALTGQACRLTNFPDLPAGAPDKFYLVQLLDNPGHLASDDGAVSPVEGLPTKRGTPPGATADNTCVDVVDIAPGAAPSRYLWVQFADVARDNPSMSHQKACDTASAAATAAIRSLNQTPG